MLIPVCCRRAKIHSNFALVNSVLLRIRLVSKAGIDIYDSFCLVEVQRAAAAVVCTRVDVSFSFPFCLSSVRIGLSGGDPTVRIHSSCLLISDSRTFALVIRREFFEND